MKIDTKVILRTFAGSANAPAGTANNENYWRLIGTTGIVIDDKNPDWAPLLGGHRVLVLFDTNPSDSGLESHNEVPNSLWIAVTDLELDHSRD